MSDWTKVLITGDASGEVVGIQLAKRRRRPFAKFVRYNLIDSWARGCGRRGGISLFEGTGTLIVWSRGVSFKLVSFIVRPSTELNYFLFVEPASFMAAPSYCHSAFRWFR